MQNQISIPKPCNENWDATPPQEQRRHCDKCQLVVTDFIKMNKEEIISYFDSTTAKVCGRFYQDQLIQTSSLTSKLKKLL